MRIQRMEDLVQLHSSTIVRVDISKLPAISFELEDRNEERYLLTLTPTLSPGMVGNLLAVNMEIHIQVKEVKPEP